MENEELDKLRHSASHLLAAAVLELWPKTKLTIGPAIETGFYYDFDFGETKITEEDFSKIEAKMQEILKFWNAFEQREVTVLEALKLVKDNEYKTELVNEFAANGEKITFYKAGNFEDLCSGGHADNPSIAIGAFKLLSVAGAYWRGSEKNKMLTRIYGTAFSTKEELTEFLQMQEEAKKRDHRKLGKDLGLFVFSDLVGSGLPLWTAKGSVIRRELERFIVDEEIKRGYQHVYTPDIAKLDLYKTSGHYPYYKDSMYAPIKIDDDEFMLRPMTCPHHFELYKAFPKSYKDLPVRIAELAKLYRYEKSGELTGLIRVRSFCLADAHIIISKEQADSEIDAVLDLIEFVAKTFGLEPNLDYWYRLSLGDRKDNTKYFKDDTSWELAEGVLRGVLAKRSVKNYEAEGEAAFYGPKIDIQMKNINGKEDTAFTVQYDFVMPKRFNLRYVNEEGTEVEPVVIHRSSIGAIERIIGFLIERYAGKFPLWLSPVQIAILPISEKQSEYSLSLFNLLMEKGLRVELFNDNETLGNKIRKAGHEKIPYILVVGDKEVQNSTINVRLHSGENLGEISVQSLIDRVQEEIKNKK